MIAIEDLFADAVFSGASISADGERLAYLAPRNNRTQVWLRGIDEEHDAAICLTNDTRRGIKQFGWTDNPRYLIYVQDTDGNEDWHLWRVDVENPDAPAVDLTPNPPGVRAYDWKPVGWKPGHVMVSMNIRPMFFDQWLINVETGETTLFLEAPGYMEGYSTDSAGVVRFYNDTLPDGTYRFFAIDDPSKPTERRLIATRSGPQHPLGIYPAQPTVDGSGLLLGLYPEGSDDLSLVRVDGQTGEETVVAAMAGHSICTMGYINPRYPQTLLMSRKTDDVIAVRFVGDRPILKVIDPAYEGLFAKLQALMPDGVIAAAQSDREERRWLVTFVHDREPGLVFLYDAETETSKLLFRPFPQLDPSDMAPMQAVHIEARDGLPLTAFLTVPVGVEAKNLPLVLKVHGGPWCHDMWLFDREVQFLANRGYAVLQINMRCSSGYGKAHTLAGIHELGFRMHDDLIDFCEWAVAEGIADRDRIGIYGGSYGGYATLIGVTMTPDYFAAAVDHVGISDWANFLKTLPEFTRPSHVNNFHAYIGDPSTPEGLAAIEKCSPIHMADRITTPLLVSQGAMDPRVVQAEADNIVNALRERGVPVEYMLCEDEGHGFVNPENIIELFRRIESHFGAHL